MSFWNNVFGDEGSSYDPGEGYKYYDNMGSNYYDNNNVNDAGDNGGDHGDDNDGDNGCDIGGENDSCEHQDLYDTNKVFSSREDLVKWASKVGRDNGWVLVTKRSKKSSSGEFVKVWIICDRGGEYKGAPKLRKTGTKKTNCPFELHGKYVLNMGGWIIHVKNNKHNHDPDEHLAGHAYAMRLSEEDLDLVQQLRQQNVDPKNILGALKQKNPANVSSLKTIYNAITKVKKSNTTGETPMQVLFCVLKKHNYIYTPCVDEATNTVEGVFFIHPKSYTLWRAYPHVLMIDSTYKTNSYRMPFVQMVGVTSTLKSFSVAHAFINSEREENFRWVLQQLKDTLEHKCIEPRVILTDRDLALVNACEKEFPNAVRQLCRWHISENILKHCKPSFPDKEEWGRFEYLWSCLINSATPDIYAYHYDRLYRRLIPNHSSNFHGPLSCSSYIFLFLIVFGLTYINFIIYFMFLEALMYLNDNWLNPYKEKFVTAWIDRERNFGQHTTNRVESQHALLKSHLKSTNSTMHSFVPFINDILKSQEDAIKESFTRSKIMLMIHHKHDLFQLLRGKVSIAALDLLFGELNRRDKILISRRACGCRLFTTCGLPCACRLDNYLQTGTSIPLDDIDTFWTKLDFSPAYIDQSEKVDVQKEMDLVTKHLLVQPEPTKRSYISRIKAMINPTKAKEKAPNVQTHTRGRPKKDKKNENTVDPPRHSSYVKQEQHIPVPGRHSSSIVMSSQTKGQDQMGLSQKSTGYSYTPGDEEMNNFKRFKYNIPSFFHPYISSIYDVMADGNCGFRAIAVALGYHENQWPFIRSELLAELHAHEDWYKIIFPEGEFYRIHNRCNWNGLGFAPLDHWMEIPPAGILCANRFGVILLHLSINNNLTFFPFWTSPFDIMPHRMIAIALVGNHYIRVQLQEDCPMPEPSKYWYRFKNKDAANWEVIYRERIKIYVDARPVMENNEPIDLM